MKIQVSLVPVTEVAPSGPATEQLLQELTSDNDDKARAAVSAISYFSQYGNFDTAVAVPQLMSLLGDNRMVVRFRAASCLAFLRTAAEPAISKLVGALNDEHEWVRSAAAEALGEIGAPAAEAIPHLERLSNDVSYGPRGRAVEALQKIRRK